MGGAGETHVKPRWLMLCWRMLNVNFLSCSNDYNLVGPFETKLKGSTCFHYPVRRIHIPLECLSKVRVELSSKTVIIC